MENVSNEFYKAIILYEKKKSKSFFKKWKNHEKSIFKVDDDTECQWEARQN